MEPNQDYSFDCNKYIDSHCHLQDYSSVELEQVLSNCISKGLQLIYTNATNKDDFDSTLDISKDKSSGKIKMQSRSSASWAVRTCRSSSSRIGQTRLNQHSKNTATKTF